MADVFTFDDNGDPPVHYELLSRQKGVGKNLELRSVGTFKSSIIEEEKLIIDNNAIVWKGGHKEVRGILLLSCAILFQLTCTNLQFCRMRIPNYII